MSRPKRIILVRHGQSTGNLDKSAYQLKQDSALEITEKGKLQVELAALELRNKVESGANIFYVSPYSRTRQTATILQQRLGGDWREDPRLREQEWHNRIHDAIISPTYGSDMHKEQLEYGQFFYRFAGAESCADVYDRASSFLDSLYRHFEKPDFPENCFIITHGCFMRVFLMRWMHWTVEAFENLKNPRNAEYWTLERQDDGKYKLIADLNWIDLT